MIEGILEFLPPQILARFEREDRKSEPDKPVKTISENPATKKCKKKKKKKIPLSNHEASNSKVDISVLQRTIDEGWNVL